MQSIYFFLFIYFNSCLSFDDFVFIYLFMFCTISDSINSNRRRKKMVRNLKKVDPSAVELVDSNLVILNSQFHSNFYISWN